MGIRGHERRQVRGLTVKLVIPFLVILIVVVAAFSTVFIRWSRGLLLEGLERRAQVMARPLAAAAADGVTVSSETRVQQLIDEARRADPDIAYAVVLDAQGRAFAATDPALAGKILLRDDFERSMAKIDGPVRREVPGAGGLFEVALPLESPALGRVGVLRLGVSPDAVAAFVRGVLWLAIGGATVAVVTGIVVYVLIARRFIRPLRDAAGRLEELATGEADLYRRLEISSTDEIGNLAHSFNAFLGKLGALVLEVREAAVGVQSAAQRVSGSSEQLAASTQEQASALEQTAASLEEITATVRQNSESARQASELAQVSRAVAEEGRRVVEDVVSAMNRISGSARRITDISTVIDEIAFQTNLLSLNAAVEAARAGEHGRGFAVVAAEVRSLAQRSAGASREIKELIRGSVSEVEQGVELVDRSGVTLREIVVSAERVAALVAEIAGASTEQSHGIDQVSRAVSEMDHVTQRNASHTEELSATAGILAAQAAELQELVRRFRLAEDETRELAGFPSPPVDSSRVTPKSPASAGGSHVHAKAGYAIAR